MRDTTVKYEEIRLDVNTFKGNCTMHGYSMSKVDCIRKSTCTLNVLTHFLIIP